VSDVSTIFRVWEHQGPGYVALPRKLRSTNSPKGAKNHTGKWEEHNFKWPEDLEEIKKYIQESHKAHYDLYWCPSILTQGRRVKDNIPQMSVLYADLDEVNPQGLALKPSVAWESSPGRYAAVWFLDKPLPAQEVEHLNKSLTYFIGADKGGWDLTQVLRVPGTRNHKYEGSPPGKLMWYNESIINPSDIPQLPVEQEVAQFDEELIVDSSPERLLSVINSVKNQIKPKTLSLLITGEDEILLYDRSEKLWELECQLLEQGISPSKVLELVACSYWNKYRGRKDEMRRLQTEIDKALTHTGKDNIQKKQAAFEKQWTSYAELLGKEIEQPGWMIKDVWQRTSHGMIAGEPKTYKSVIATDMAVSVASGKPFLGQFPVEHQGPVMYIQEENSPWLVKDRVTKISHTRGALNGSAKMNGSVLSVNMPLELPLYFLNNQGFDFTNEEDRQFLENSIAEIKPVLIIFDPLYLMLGDKDESSSRDIRPVLNWLLTLRYTYKTSVIVIHHWNKSGKSERGGQRMLGSVLWHGWVESALYTKVINEQQHQIEVEREFRSFGKPGNISMTFNFGQPGELDYQVTVSNDVKGAGDQVLQLLSDAIRVTVDDVVNALGLSTRQAKIRLDRLVKDGKATELNNIYTYKEED